MWLAEPLLTCLSAPCRRSPRIRWASRSTGPRPRSPSGHSSWASPWTVAPVWPGSWDLRQTRGISDQGRRKLIIIHAETRGGKKWCLCRYLISADWKPRLLLRLLTTFPRKNPSPFHIHIPSRPAAGTGINHQITSQGNICNLVFANNKWQCQIVKYYISRTPQDTFHGSCRVGKQAICNPIFLRHNLIIAAVTEKYCNYLNDKICPQQQALCDAVRMTKVIMRGIITMIIFIWRMMSWGQWPRVV